MLSRQVTVQPRHSLTLSTIVSVPASTSHIPRIDPVTATDSPGGADASSATVGNPPSTKHTTMADTAAPSLRTSAPSRRRAGIEAGSARTQAAGAASASQIFPPLRVWSGRWVAASTGRTLNEACDARSTPWYGVMGSRRMGRPDDTSEGEIELGTAPMGWLTSLPLIVLVSGWLLASVTAASANRWPDPVG